MKTVRLGRVTGAIFLILGLVANQWVLAAFLSTDGSIDNPLTRLMIHVFDLVMIAAGILLLTAKTERLQHYWRRIGLLTTSSIITVILLEAALHGFNLTPGGWSTGIQRVWCEGPGREAGERMRFDPEFGWTLYPSTVFLEKRTHSDWELFTYNQSGFRDQYNRGSSSTIVLGDSYMHGTLVGDSEAPVHLIDQWTSDRRFLNRSVPGYGTAQQLLLYRRMAPRHSHDLVVIGYYMNDPADNLNRDPRRPRFELVKNQLQQTHTPVNPLKNPLAHPGWFLQKQSFTLNLLAQSSNALLRWMGDENKGGHLRSRPNEPLMQKQLNLTRALLLEIDHTAQRHGAEVLTIAIPSRTVHYPEHPKHFRPSAARQYWNRQKEMLKSTADSSPTFHFLTMDTAIRRAVDEGYELYGRTDGHFNERGYWLTARTLLDRLKQNGWIKKGSQGPLREHAHPPRCPGR